MALLWVEGFEGFTAAGNRTVLDPIYNFKNTIATTEAGMTSGRVTGRGIFIDDAANQTSNTESHGLQIPVTGLSTQDDWIVGFAFRSVDQQFNTDRMCLLEFINNDSDPLMNIYANAGTITARRGWMIGTGTQLGIATVNLSSGIWYYFEAKVKLHASTGSIVVRINEVEVLNLSGINTTQTGDVAPASIIVAGGQGGFRMEMDDLYICDDTGGTHNDFLGDNKVSRLSPNGNGTTSNLAGSDGNSVDNYLLVLDSDPDGDSTYVQSATVGQKDTYNFADLTVTPAAIEAVTVKSYAKKTDGGSRTFKHIARSSTTETDSAAISPSTDYQHHQSIYLVDPNTGSAWTKSGVDAAQFGMKVFS